MARTILESTLGQIAVEYRQEVVNMAKKFFHLPEDERLQLTICDAVRYIRGKKDTIVKLTVKKPDVELTCPVPLFYRMQGCGDIGNGFKSTVRCFVSTQLLVNRQMTMPNPTYLRPLKPPQDLYQGWDDNRIHSYP